MSAHHILGCAGPKGWSVRPLKVVRELGSERRETARTLSSAGDWILEKTLLLVRETGARESLVYQLFQKSIAG